MKKNLLLPLSGLSIFALAIPMATVSCGDNQTKKDFKAFYEEQINKALNASDITPEQKIQVQELQKKFKENFSKGYDAVVKKMKEMRDKMISDYQEQIDQTQDEEEKKQLQEELDEVKKAKIDDMLKESLKISKDEFAKCKTTTELVEILKKDEVTNTLFTGEAPNI